MYWDHTTGWGWGMMVFWSVIWIALLGLVAWAIATWARATTPTSPQLTEQANSARQVLDDRLARGDIDVDQYERRRTANGPRLLGLHPNLTTRMGLRAMAAAGRREWLAARYGTDLLGRSQKPSRQGSAG